MTHKITPHLWFDKEAKEAAELYTALFPGSRVTNVNTIHDTPSGDCDIVSFELTGQPFMAISAGPLFRFNPSVSFHVKYRTREEVDALWGKLSKGGTVLMELGAYPFSERYGWLQDRYGLSWQVNFVGAGKITQQITPVLMFVGSVAGKAEEAISAYASIFRDGTVEVLARYGKGEEPDKEGSLKYASFSLLGQEFGALDSALQHNFNFNEAISFIVPCDTQEEIDYYWKKLSSDPKAEQCGWLKDRYGLSWQVTPVAMSEMLKTKDAKKLSAVTAAFLKMKKFDIAELERVYNAS